MFRFASPYFFLLLAIVPAAVFYRTRKQVLPAMGVSGTMSVRDIGSSLGQTFGRIVPVLKYAALCLMIAALARPQWGTKKITVMTEGINIALAVDLSESMAALDFKVGGKVVNRLDAVRNVIRDFVSKRAGDRIAMVVFGSEAYTQLPLTRDYDTIVSILERLRIGAAGPSTAVGDALGISVKRLGDIESKSNIVILLTDGRSNSGEFSPESAAEIAAKKKIKVYTVGIGTAGKPVLFKHPVYGYVKQRFDMDEATLRMIAEKTGGMYFNAMNVDELKGIYDTIDRLEKTEVKMETFAEYKEYYHWLLIPAFVLLGLGIVLSNTRFLRIP